MTAAETTPARTSEDGSVTHTMKTNSTTDAPSKTSSSIGILRSTRHRRSEDASDSVDPPPSLTSNNPTISEKEQKEEDKRVCILRSAMIATLLSATVVVASLTYVFVHRSEEQTFVNQYRDSVAKVAEAFQAGLNSKRDVAQTFSAIYTSRYGNDAQDPSVWPNATMPDFQQQAEAQLRLSNGRAMSFNPIITQDVDRLEWEAHAEESAWILGSPQLIEPEEGTEWPDNRTVSFGIYSRDADKNVIYDPGYAEASVYPSVLVPVWQIAPIVTNEKAVMFNLHSEPNRMRALDDMLTYRLTTLTAILQLVQDVELRPSAILFYPVFDEFNSDIDNIDKNVVGSISVVFSWDDLLKKILPNYIKGMICVLKSSIDQTYTYSISGDRVTLLGEGDQHDAKYDDMGVTAEADLSETDEALGVVNYLITYTLTMYPSQEFEDQYVTNKAIIYTVGVVLIFLCTAGLFLLYDYLVENRQQKTARLAKQTSTIVDSMFPAAFRDRLYKSNAASPATRRSSAGATSDGGGQSGGSANQSRRYSEQTQDTARASNTTGSVIRPSKRFSAGSVKTLKQIDKFMKRSSDVNIAIDERGAGVDEPIADLFLDTSIMFSDIVGFTKWSSERSPHEVFKLLERLFWEFDDIAARLNVFKLGTIGDCYIAVTGIPDPIDEHATLLTMFAFECRDKVREVCAELEMEGLDTAKLDMRFGIHSGAITAGILRGTKSRFELFGDTINTASRMESTGEAGKIQLSEETAELLRMDNMEKWLTKRDKKITAKGKGELQTYWAEKNTASKRISFEETMLADKLTAENLQSLTESEHTEKYFNAEYGNTMSDSEQQQYDEEMGALTAQEENCKDKVVNGVNGSDGVGKKESETKQLSGLKDPLDIFTRSESNNYDDDGNDSA